MLQQALGGQLMLNIRRYFEINRSYHVIRCFLSAVLFLLISVSLTACGGGFGGVQFEGKLFEAVGLNEIGAKKKEPKVKQRGTLVIPPKTELPEPGKRVVVKDNIQWPDDPDERKKREVELLEEKKKKVCKDVVRDRKHPLYDEEKAKLCSTWLGDYINDTLNKTPSN